MKSDKRIAKNEKPKTKNQKMKKEKLSNFTLLSKVSLAV